MDKWITIRILYTKLLTGNAFGVPVSDLCDGQLFARTSRKLTTHKSEINNSTPDLRKIFKLCYILRR
ncbi:hypothetical protein VCRA2119O381_790011 [Vibrio crassostreae]|nr:hypothetical protein VCRA2119O381_790011 [Vibrio crassostreae]